MKHLTFCLLLFLTLLLCCISSQFYVNDRVQQTELQLKQAYLLHDKGEQQAAAEYIQIAAKKWTQYEHFFGTVLQHNEIDHVNGELARLLAYVTSTDEDDFRSSCAALLSDLAHIREMERPIWSNIF